MDFPTQTLSELAASITSNASAVEGFLKSKNLPQPSFDKDAPVFMGIPPTPDATDAAEAYRRLLESIHQIQALAMGPVGMLLSTSSENVMILNFIHRFNIAAHVPTSGTISYEDLSSATGAPLIDLRRLVRAAIHNFIFTEPTIGQVAHTLASRQLAENAVLRDMVGISVDEFFPASAKVTDALHTYPTSEDQLHTGWALANDAKAPLFEELDARHPDRAKRFVGAMAFAATTVSPTSFTDTYPWGDLADGATVVDIGGGRGPVAIAVARKFPNVKFIVQDLKDAVQSGRAELPQDVGDRVTFQEHDFFAEQPVKGADMYFFRAVFHDWPDSACVKMLQALIPALKPGAKVLINDPYVPEAYSMPRGVERFSRSADLRMMVLFRARDRELAEWPGIFERADPRFKVLGFREPERGIKGMPKSTLKAFIEVEWTG